MMATRDSNVWAVVLAAGLGRRFAEQAGPSAPPKLLAPLAGRPILARVLDALDQSQVAGVVAVVNDRIAAEVAALRPPTDRRRYVLNPNPAGPMFASVRLGLIAAIGWAMHVMKQQYVTSQPASGPAFVFCPGDLGGLHTGLVDRCIEKWQNEPDRLIIAAHHGQAGHPIILPADLADAVLAWPPSDRLNLLRERYPERVSLLELDDPAAVRDIDTPADLTACEEEA